MSAAFNETRDPSMTLAQCYNDWQWKAITGNHGAEHMFGKTMYHKPVEAKAFHHVAHCACRRQVLLRGRLLCAKDMLSRAV